VPGFTREPRRRRLAAGLLIAAAGLAGGCAGHAGGGTGSGTRQPESPAGTAQAGTAQAGQHPVGSPLSPRWRGDSKPVTLVFGGDVHFEGAIGARLAADPVTALSGSVGVLMSGADVAMTNFESALTDGGGCPDPQDKQFVFHSPSAALTAFASAGVSVVTEANNHGEDCGLAGLEQSLAIARSAAFPVIGIGRNAARAFAPYRAVVHGQRTAIIAATQVLDTNLKTAWTATAHQPGLASAYRERVLVAAVQRARRTSDTVAVYLHWGTETQQCPNTLQPPLARALVRAGSDIVVGAHAHVQLGAGFLGSALVDYGLGNLAFYDTAAPETYSGTLIVRVTGRHIDGFRWRPALIESGLPVPEKGPAAAAARHRWRALRACTGLSAQPAASIATRRSETAGG